MGETEFSSTAKNSTNSVSSVRNFISGAYPENAVKGGFEDDVILYVARAKDPDGGACIGKLHPRHKVCYFPWKGKEHHSYEYEVLCCI